jgi:hypothetical protein
MTVATMIIGLVPVVEHRHERGRHEAHRRPDGRRARHLILLELTWLPPRSFDLKDGPSLPPSGSARLRVAVARAVVLSDATGEAADSTSPCMPAERHLQRRATLQRESPLPRTRRPPANLYRCRKPTSLRPRCEAPANTGLSLTGADPAPARSHAEWKISSACRPRPLHPEARRRARRGLIALEDGQALQPERRARGDEKLAQKDE